VHVRRIIPVIPGGFKIRHLYRPVTLIAALKTLSGFTVWFNLAGASSRPAFLGIMAVIINIPNTSCLLYKEKEI